MKKTTLWIRSTALTIVFVLTLCFSSYASPSLNVVSPEEAANLALFYYCSNQPTNDLISIDHYVATPLYDNEGNITYYAIDFFFEGEPKGYVLIGKNLEYLQCPELGLEGNSPYYLNALEGNETIYFNPSAIYSVSNNNSVVYDTANHEIDKSDATGEILTGNISKNSAILYSTLYPDYAEDSIDSFEEHPAEYLEILGYENITSTNMFGTCEAMMNSAGAFGYMYSIPENGKYWVDGIWLYNSNHCVLTMITNLLLYWRHKCNLSYFPSSYDAMFRRVLTVAVNGGYFQNTLAADRQGRGAYDSHVDEIIDGMFEIYGIPYGTDYSFSYETSLLWNYIKSHIDADMPVYMAFHQECDHSEHTFAYKDHATIVFGYNSVLASKDGYDYEYRFIKLFDGWTHYTENNNITYESTGKRYVCWQALVSGQLNIGHSITSYMCCLCPKI